MAKTVGIRMEDKNRWERRAPLAPPDVAALRARLGARFVIEASPIRVFREDAYQAAGATVEPGLDAADIITAVKEVPAAKLLPGKIYLFFAHVVKGQAGNMPMLARLMKLGCTLIDYERIVDEQGRRLIFFGRFAGQAGAIDTLHCLGRRLSADGYSTPLSEVRMTHDYHDVADAKAHLADIGRRLLAGGLPDALRPLTLGITGYGHVSLGAQEVLDALPLQEVTPAELAAASARSGDHRPALVKVVFKEQDMVRPVDAGAAFELQDYYKHPEHYASRFEDYLPHLDVLLQAIYWTPRYPRFVTRDWARRAYASGASPRLRAIGDISCDIDGGIELTTHATTPEAPCFVFDPQTGTPRDGVLGPGPVVMSIDNLPCELSREASEHFSSVLSSMMPDLLSADWAADFASIALPPPLKRAVIVHRGALTPDYEYLRQSLASAGALTAP
jgi:alpha-aminoadipic semialdehyde synthase